jgi:hypothetical protein
MDEREKLQHRCRVIALWAGERTGISRIVPANWEPWYKRRHDCQVAEPSKTLPLGPTDEVVNVCTFECRKLGTLDDELQVLEIVGYFVPGEPVVVWTGLRRL